MRNLIFICLLSIFLTGCKSMVMVPKIEFPDPPEELMKPPKPLKTLGERFPQVEQPAAKNP